MSAPAQEPTPEPNPWEPVFHQAIYFHSRGQLPEAASLFAAIVEHNPQHFASLQRLAAIRRQQGRTDEALALLERAVESNPESAETHNSLGNTLAVLERTEEAVREYKVAIGLRDNFPEAHFNLANALRSLKRFEEAAQGYECAIRFRPNYVDAHTNFAIVLERLNRPEEALDHFAAALQLDPTVKMGYGNVGMALTDLNRHEEALPYLKKAREVAPDAPESKFNEALVHLCMGNYEQAWDDYEARWELPEFLRQRQELMRPLWDGRSDITGKTILLTAEQGLGDSIMFSRFVEGMVKKAARVMLVVQKPLVQLMKSIPGVAEVFTLNEPVSDFDLYLPFGSLPRVFGTTLANVPCRVPYLKAEPHSETIEGLEKTGGRPLVGVCWAGNPEYKSDYKRSIPLAMFEKVLECSNPAFISLQQNLRPGEMAILEKYANIDLMRIRNSKALADTATLISKLDLVITVDTAIGHLAGALGRPVWILQRFSAYWVWLRHRSDSPWYPTARLFRQSEPGGWQNVVDGVAGALGKFRC